MPEVSSSSARQGLLWSYLILAYAGLFGLGLIDMIRGPFFPDVMATLNLKEGEGSLFFAVPSLVAFFGNALAGAASGRVSPIWGQRLSLLAMASGFWLVSQAQTFKALLAACILFGLGFGMVSVFQNLLVKMGADEHWRRRLFSGLHSVYAFSSLSAPLLAREMLKVGWSWREAFAAVSLFPGVVAVCSFLFFYRCTPGPEAVSRPPSGSVPLSRRLAYGWVLGLYICGELALSTRLPLYLRREHGATPEGAAAMLALFFAGLLTGRLAFTFFRFSRWSNRDVLMTALILAATLFVLGLSLSPWLLALTGLAMAPVFAVALDHQVEVFGDQAASVISLSLALGSLLVVTMHSVVGSLSEILPLGHALFIGPACLALAALRLWRLPEPRPVTSSLRSP